MTDGTGRSAVVIKAVALVGVNVSLGVGRWGDVVGQVHVREHHGPGTQSSKQAVTVTISKR